MTVAATIALMAAALAVYVAALSRRFSLAPGWRDLRWFSLAALAVAGYAALDVPTAVIAADSLVVLASRAQFVCAGVHLFAWLRYSDTHLGVRPSRARTALAVVPLALTLFALVPEIFYGGAVRVHTFAPFGISYKDAVPTAFGELVYALVIGFVGYVTARYALAWRRGVPQAALHFFALAFLLAMATNDALAASGVLNSPYLIDLGFIVPIGAVGYSLTARFAADARALAELRLRLESLVDDRTRDLARAQEALHRAEKLAALGQFAAGVAHEVNNPAAVVAANLKYLAECRTDDGAWPADTGDCVSESLTAMDRIARIVRQLLDASRLAAAPVAVEAVSLARVAQESLRTARARCGQRVPLEANVPEDVLALGQESMLVQIAVNLVVNAVQAIPADRGDGKVRVTASRGGGRVRLAVEDNGSGMTEEVLRRIFEPFFSTKPFGGGTGLGLAVSRGLVQSLGGDLRFESEVGRGTRALVELPEAPARAHHAGGPPRSVPVGRRRRILVVDDEPAVLRSLARGLSSRYIVETAGGVDEGLLRLSRARYDLVLCDVMMPVGGGERLHGELARRDPEQAALVVFITGGATSEDARRFLAAQAQPVLDKPLDLVALAAVAERLGGAGAAA
ncbi:MAG TPA: ATP-binding protein [Anaeromyxobacteraceae bacterium]